MSLKNQMTKAAFGISAREAIHQSICAKCRIPVSNDIFPSRKELIDYLKTGLCPSCFFRVHIWKRRSHEKNDG